MRFSFSICLYPENSHGSSYEHFHIAHMLAEVQNFFAILCKWIDNLYKYILLEKIVNQTALRKALLKYVTSTLRNKRKIIFSFFA